MSWLHIVNITLDKGMKKIILRVRLTHLCQMCKPDPQMDASTILYIINKISIFNVKFFAKSRPKKLEIILTIPWKYNISNNIWLKVSGGHSSVGRVQASQAWGRGFEARCPLHQCINQRLNENPGYWLCVTLFEVADLYMARLTFFELWTERCFIIISLKIIIYYST